MRWTSVIAWEALICALMASSLTWVFYHGTKVILVRSKGWLAWFNDLPDKVQVWVRVFAVFGSMFLIGDVVSILEPVARIACSHLLEVLGIEGTQIAVSVLVLIYGFAAYQFKVKNQVAYGIVEVIFAGAAGVVFSKNITTSSAVSLIGAAYVVSRGVNNFVEGLEKRKSLVTGGNPETALSTSP